MAWLPRLRIYRSELSTERFAERGRGTLIHRCLELLQVDERTTDEDTLQAERAVARAMRSMANPHDPAAFRREMAEVEGACLDAATWLLAQPELRRYLAHGRPEASLADAEGRLLRVDLFYEDEAETVVLEYKTGAPRPEHARQLGRYLRLLAQRRGTAPDRIHKGYLVYLDEGRVEPILLDNPTGAA